MNINILLINALLYIVILLYFLRKKGLTIYTMLWFEFAIIAFLGYYTFEVGIYEDTFGTKRLSDLTMLPYLFVLFGYIIAFEPFRNISTHLDTTIPYRKYTNFLLYLYIIVMTAYLILKIVEASVAVQYGLADTKNLGGDEGVSLFDYSDNIFLRRLNTVRYLFQVPLTPFIVAYCVQCWQRRERTLMTIILMVLCFLPDIFASVSRGGRAGIFVAFMNILFFAILYLRQIPARVKKVGLIGIAGFLILAGSYSLAITEDRFQKADSPITPVLRYFGEAFPNFGFNYYGKLRAHTNGGFHFGGVTGDYKKHRIESLGDAQKFYSIKTGVPMQNFKTYWGGMYIEFGEIGAFVFIIVYALIIKFLITPRLTIYNMCFLYFYFRQMTIAFAAGVKTGSLIPILAIFIASFCIKKFYFNSNEILEKTTL